MILKDLKKVNKIAILGFGKEGKSTLTFLLRLGISSNNITILDKNHIISDTKTVRIILGDKYLDTLNDFDIIFKSPGISPYHDKIKPYRNKLTSQTEIFFDNYKGKTIGITGTKGKSTISTLIYKTLLTVDYNVKLVGNIGNPVFDEIDLLDSNGAYNYIIYELSSYMLEMFQPKCSIALISNIYTCHLDWHSNDFGTYENAKLNILKNSDNKLISDNIINIRDNIDNFYTYGLEGKYQYNLNNQYFRNGDKIFTTEDIQLLGEHNKKNICGVIGILDIITEKYNHNSTWIFSKLLNALGSVLKDFSGLPHRLEKIGKYNGITFIDDGISTTPESTIEAINTFGDQTNTIFLGGGDYGFTKESYILLKDKIIEHGIQNIVLFPDTGLDIFNIDRCRKKVGDMFNEIYKNNNLNILFTDNMDTAINFAYQNTGKNNICLMSCAAPSYSLWTGYEEKGREFKKYIDLYIK